MLVTRETLELYSGSSRRIDNPVAGLHVVIKLVSDIPPAGLLIPPWESIILLSESQPKRPNEGTENMETEPISTVVKCGECGEHMRTSERIAGKCANPACRTGMYAYHLALREWRAACKLATDKENARAKAGGYMRIDFSGILPPEPKLAMPLQPVLIAVLSS